MIQPEIPVVSLLTWKRLLKAFHKFERLDPWEVLDDEGLFGVEDPGTRQLGYGCVMGALGQVHGLCLYRREKSLAIYQKMMNDELDPESEEVVGAQDALTAEWAETKYLETADIAVLESLGVYDKALPLWPRFRSHVPGHRSWFLNEGEAEFLAFGLDCAEDLVRRVESACLDWPAPSHAIPLYRYDGSGKSGRALFKREFGSLPLVQPQPPAGLQLDLSKVGSVLSRSPRPDSSWEADVFPAPFVLNDRARPYIPLNVLVAQQVSGFVFDVQVEAPETEPAQMIADAVLRSIERHGWLPSDIRVRDGKLAAALAPLAKALGIPIKEQRPLRSIDEARRGMQSFLGKGNGRGDGPR